MNDLPHSLERTVVICARRSTVFRFFTDSARFARWWGEGSSIDARPGGAVHIRYPNDVLAGGEVVEVVPDERIVFTYGYDAGQPIPRGASLVTVTLRETPDGTVVALRHEFADSDVRDAHRPGWRYQLGVFASVASEDQHAGLEPAIDRWFAAWNDADPRPMLADDTTEDVAFRDRFACVSGREELAQHIVAARRHMPELRLERDGDVAQCQGTALAGWLARGPDGAVIARGRNVFELAPDGRLRRVTGLWTR